MGPRGALLALLLASACERKPTRLEEMGLSEAEARKILVEIERSAQPPPTAPRSPPAPRPSEPRPNPAPVGAPVTALEQDLDPELKSDRYIVDGLVDVSDAAPSTAHARGVFVASADQRLLLAPLGALPKTREPAPSPVAELHDDVESQGVGRGPSLSDTHAYWIRGRELYRQALADTTGTGTVIASDARVATRVSAATVGADEDARDLVAYIGLPQEPDGPLVARLWSEGAEIRTLSEPGSAALSVQLSRRGEAVMAYTLEGRTSMSILHERELMVDNPVTLGQDRVVWVGGAATPTTELRVARGTDDALFGLLPVEQDTTHFGLALLSLSAIAGEQPAPVEWVAYPNGMDYAPTAATVVCGRLVVLFARPSSGTPHSPQELVLGELHAGRLSHELVLGRSKVFYDLSLAALEGGALVSYVSDRRTWARTLRCRPEATHSATP